jgi:hypothetical protein
MQKTSIAFEGTADAVQILQSNLTQSDIKVGKPTDVASAADAFNAPVGPEDIKAAIQIVTMILQTATAAVTLIGAIRKVFAAQPKAVLVAKDPASGQVRGHITAASSDEDIKKLLANPS